MIGGLVSMTLDKSILRQLGAGRSTVIVTGTNGKSTTTRMTAAALGTRGAVATNAFENGLVDSGCKKTTLRSFNARQWQTYLVLFRTP